MNWVVNLQRRCDPLEETTSNWRANVGQVVFSGMARQKNGESLGNVSSPHTVSIWVYKTWMDYSDRTSYYQILSHVATILFWWCLWFLSVGFNIVSFSPCQKGRWFSFPNFTKLCVFPKIHVAIVLIPPRVLSLIFFGIKQCKFMVNLRDFPCNHALFGLVI